VFGRALSRACDKAVERTAIATAGGFRFTRVLSDSGKINEWRTALCLRKFFAKRDDEVRAYADEDTPLEVHRRFENHSFIALDSTL